MLDTSIIENEKPTSSVMHRDIITGPPLDLSFKGLVHITELDEEIKKHSQPSLILAPSTDMMMCNAVRLNNNSLTELYGFDKVMETFLENPQGLEWIDVSFNELNAIDKIITKFPNLKVLYLHGNTIEKIQEINKLAVLSKLISLTLHGNPIESEKGYRQYVLSILPGLKTLDFSGVTKQDRSTADTWNSTKNGKRKISN